MATTGPVWGSSQLADQGSSVYVGKVAKPATGWVAFFAELVYDNAFSQRYSQTDEYDYHFTTEVRVLPEVLLFEADLSCDGTTDVLDMAILSDAWLSDNAYRDIAPRRGGDGIIDLDDFGVIGLHRTE